MLVPRTAYSQTVRCKANKRKSKMKEILLAYKKGKANAQIAHLVFADIQANSEKPKELFFSQRSGRNDKRKSNFACLRASHRQENE